jgi:peptidoglycan hydrolase-like protein with peptidoglycan-binding domain
LRAWQTAAGIAADGIYGRGTASALKYFTPKAPRALFAQGQDGYPWR